MEDDLVFFFSSLVLSSLLKFRFREDLLGKNFGDLSFFSFQLAHKMLSVVMKQKMFAKQSFAKNPIPTIQ